MSWESAKGTNWRQQTWNKLCWWVPPTRQVSGTVGQNITSEEKYKGCRWRRLNLVGNTGKSTIIGVHASTYVVEVGRGHAEALRRARGGAAEVLRRRDAAAALEPRQAALALPPGLLHHAHTHEYYASLNSTGTFLHMMIPSKCLSSAGNHE